MNMQVDTTYTTKSEALRRVGVVPPHAEVRNLDCNKLSLRVCRQRLDDRVIDTVDEGLVVALDGNDPAN